MLKKKREGDHEINAFQKYYGDIIFVSP